MFWGAMVDRGTLATDITRVMPSDLEDVNFTFDVMKENSFWGPWLIEKRNIFGPKRTYVYGHFKTKNAALKAVDGLAGEAAFMARYLAIRRSCKFKPEGRNHAGTNFQNYHEG